MRKRYTPTEWMTALERDPGLRGLSPAAAATRLNLSEPQLEELLSSGALNVADIYEEYHYPGTRDTAVHGKPAEIKP
jgi:hypothetical protein